MNKSIGFVALCFVVATVASAEDDEWQQYHYQLYATEGPELDLEKTTELIQKLHDLYQGKSDEATLKRSKRIDALLELAKLKEEKCNEEYIKNVDMLMYMMNAYRINVYPFATHQRKLQYDLCKKHAAHELEVAVHKLSAEDQTNAKDLVENIDHGKESRYYCEDKQNEVAAGVLSYLASRETSLLNKVSKQEGVPNRALVSSLVQQSIGGLCDRVEEAVKVPLQIYDKFDSTVEAEKRQDEFVSHWYHSKRVCVYVLYHLKDLMEDAYKGIKHTDTDIDGSLKSKLKKMIRH